MGNIIIRDTTFDDIPKLRVMHGAAWREAYPSPENGVSREWVEERTAGWVTPEGIERSKAHFKDIFGHSDHLHKVAVDDDEIIGLVHIFKKGKGYHLAALYIDKNHYGTGLAQKMMNLALDWSGRGQLIDLEVATYNGRAKAFYRKYGFEEIHGTESLFADTIPVITMERKGEKK